MTFDGIDRPLQSYTRALAASGFVIEQLREPQPSEADLQRAQELAPAARKPYFIHLCCSPPPELKPLLLVPRVLHSRLWGALLEMPLPASIQSVGGVAVALTQAQLVTAIADRSLSSECSLPRADVQLSGAA